MVRISVQLTEKQAEWLRKEAEDTGLAKTDIVRRTLDIRIMQDKVWMAQSKAGCSE